MARMRRSSHVHRLLATTACLVVWAVGLAPGGHAEPDDGADNVSGAPVSADPLPPPSGDLRGQKPPADLPIPPKATPFPDTDIILQSYQRHQPDEFFTASNEGVWFSTPLGLNCGIWDRGGFGCAGDIPGAPEGTTHIGWVTGNIVMRYDPLLSLQFPPGRAERVLPPRSYVEYNGTTCATTTDNSTYCVRGPFRFFVTPTRTFLSPP